MRRSSSLDMLAVPMSSGMGGRTASYNMLSNIATIVMSVSVQDKSTRLRCRPSTTVMWRGTSEIRSQHRWSFTSRERLNGSR